MKQFNISQIPFQRQLFMCVGALLALICVLAASAVAAAPGRVQATAKQDGFFKIIFLNTQGWLSASFVTTDGNCALNTAF